jgi:hypothetical protein
MHPAKCLASHSRIGSAAAVVVAVLGCGCSPDSAHDHSAHHPPPGDPLETTEVHGSKHARLLEIARAMRRSDEGYYGTARFESLLHADTTRMSPTERARWQYDMAGEYFKKGQTHEAEELWLLCWQRTRDPYASFMAGVAQLREGEVATCIERAPAEACIFPLDENARYEDRSPVERALESFRKTLDADPRGLRAQARFFLNLAHMTIGEYPAGVPAEYLMPPGLFDAGYDLGRFPNVAPDLGLAGLDHAGGAALDDFDGDGFLDVVTSSSWLTDPLRFHRSRGDGTFEDATAAAGLRGQIGGLNLLHADYDGDGRLDLLVLRGGWLGEHGRQPRSLLRNLGDGSFEDVTAAAGLDDVAYPSQTAAFGDYDLDGDLDLFIGNEAKVEEGRAYPSQLFRNDGDGTFTDVATAAGVTNLRFAKGCAWGDYDADRDPDLYVSNQFGVNRLYRNEGDGTFVDVAKELGVDGPVNSFPVWFWDYDNDGRLDLFVASYGGGRNNVFRSYLKPSLDLGGDGLFRNTGEGTFRNEALDAGLTTLTLTMGANYGDLDNDGWLDFYLGTGTPQFDALMPNVLWRNDGGRRFVDVTASAGMGNLQKGHGIAFADLDNDGDQDVFAQLGGFFEYDAFHNNLYENPGHGHSWITLELRGVDSNRYGLGSRIRVRIEENGEPRDVYRWVWASGSFGSSSWQQEIGLGAAERATEIEVYWPASDTTQSFRDVDVNRFYRVTERETELTEIERRRIVLGGKDPAL